MTSYIFKYLVIKQLLIFAIYPLAYFVFKVLAQKDINFKFLKKLCIIFIAINLMTIFTPISFYGELINEIVFFFGLFFLFLYCLYLKLLNKNIGKIMVRVGQLSTYLFPIFIFCLIINPFLTSFSLDLSGWNPRGQTSINKYRLVHYSKGSNFTYPGTHTVYIYKSLIPYLIEFKIGTATLGTFNSSDLGESTYKTTIFHENKQTEIVVGRDTKYEIEDDILIQQKYDHSQNLYIETNRFSIE